MAEAAEGWAIVQDAPSPFQNKGEHLIFALVDKGKSPDFWWTADDPDIIMQFHKKHAAVHSAARLKGAKVVPFEQARAQIAKQQEKFSAAGKKNEQSI